jgi:NAD(P)-dependent dehydrogenase (short-subunit alcohol dehydrogenase family)
MDLGLKGRTAIVCAASKGLGRACAEALAAEGVALVLNARDPRGSNRRRRKSQRRMGSRSPRSQATSQVKQVARPFSPPAPRLTSW